jgi:hypothetical protein
MPSFSSIRPTALRNNPRHKTLLESTRNDGEDPVRRTQVTESPKTLPIFYNESLSKDGASLLLEIPNWCTLSLYAHEIDVESPCN